MNDVICESKIVQEPRSRLNNIVNSTYAVNKLQFSHRCNTSLQTTCAESIFISVANYFCIGQLGILFMFDLLSNAHTWW